MKSLYSRCLFTRVWKLDWLSARMWAGLIMSQDGLAAMIPNPTDASDLDKTAVFIFKKQSE